MFRLGKCTYCEYNYLPNKGLAVMGDRMQAACHATIPLKDYLAKMWNQFSGHHRSLIEDIVACMGCTMGENDHLWVFFCSVC